MKAVLMLIFMVVLHIFADYHLQGILAQMKQKAWWSKQKTQNPSINYGFSDYMVAMIAHCIEWSFFVCLPMIFCGWDQICGEFTLAGFKLLATLIVLITANSVFHYVADDMKANDGTLTLRQDQMFHAVQIVLSWLAWTLICGW